MSVSEVAKTPGKRPFSRCQIIVSGMAVAVESWWYRQRAFNNSKILDQCHATKKSGANWLRFFCYRNPRAAGLIKIRQRPDIVI
ncbi:hypothetical protein [Microbulbifer hainanensis]|uniref:hypothetical protein n=1 Tax=Microbulbifer hainanensis TaxID=2735675 RepID=UPI0018679C93|nr:hypothetical protein [Microbulbifer hainanensis]